MGGTGHPWVIFPKHIPKRACADRGAFYMSKMRAHVAADARVTSDALFL